MKKNIKGIIIIMMLLAISLLSGCSGANPMMVPSGGMGYEIWCVDSMVSCYKEAAKQCPKGYTIQGEDQNESGLEDKAMLIIECK